MDITVKSVIYKIKCLKNDTIYIGQTVTHKKTRGKYYVYGIHSRMNEHIYASKRSNAPLYVDIRKYGSEFFNIKVLEECEIKDASNREAFYINKYNSLIPNGYNKQKVSRSYKSKIEIDPKIDDVIKIIVKGIKKDSKLSFVRIYLYKKDNTNERINFQRKDCTFDENLNRAIKFSKKITSNIIYDASLKENPTFDDLYKYKIQRCEKLNITKIKIYLCDNSIFLYFYNNNENEYSELITFGSKKDSYEEKHKKAFDFLKRLSFDKKCIINKLPLRLATGSCSLN